MGIDLKTYRPNAEEWATIDAPWVFVTDAQVRQLAEGVTVTATDAKYTPPPPRPADAGPASRAATARHHLREVLFPYRSSNKGANSVFDWVGNAIRPGPAAPVSPSSRKLPWR